MTSFLFRLFTGAHQSLDSKKGGGPRGKRLAMEPLEDRSLLSVTVADVQAVQSHFPDYEIPDDVHYIEVVSSENHGTGSLREALQVASMTTTDDIILIREGVERIDLLGTLPFFANAGQYGMVTIVGMSEDPVTISGQDMCRVFDVWNGAHINFASVVIADGNSINTYGNHNGGGVKLSNADAWFSNVTFQNNRTAGNGLHIEHGGGLFQQGGNTVLNNVSFIGNISTRGGGYSNFGDGSSVQTNVTYLDNNTFSNLPGGFYNGEEYGGGWGGAIYTSGLDLTMTNALIAGNTAFQGGGVCILKADVTLTNVTITRNSGIYGSGIYSGMSAGANVEPNITLRNSLVLGNSIDMISGVYDMFLNQGNLDFADNLFGQVMNGRPINPETNPCGVAASAVFDDTGFMLKTGSIALDAGNNDYLDGIAFDLAGHARIQNGRVDLGAFEYLFDDDEGEELTPAPVPNNLVVNAYATDYPVARQIWWDCEEAEGLMFVVERSYGNTENWEAVEIGRIVYNPNLQCYTAVFANPLDCEYDTVAYYRVVAHAPSMASSASDAVAYVNAPKPVAVMPENVTAEAISSTQIRIAWTADANDVTSGQYYLVERYVGYGNWLNCSGAILCNDSGNYEYIRTVDDTSAPHQFRVKSYVYGDSAVSEEVTATPLVAPAAPEQVLTDVVDARSIRVSWDAVQHAKSYLVTAFKDGVSFASETVPGQTEFLFDSLSPNTSYHFSVVAVNDVGQSAATLTGTVRTPYETPTAPALRLYGQPKSTSCSLLFGISAEQVLQLQGVTIEKALSPDGPWTTVYQREAAVGTYIVGQSLEPDSTCYYRLTASNAAGTAYSEILEVTSPAAVTAPEGLTITQLESGYFRIAWQPVEGAVSYELRYRKEGGYYTTKTVTETYYDVSLYPYDGSNFEAEVRAKNAVEYSPYSETLTVATPNITPTEAPTVTQTGPEAFTVEWNALPDAAYYVVQRFAEGYDYAKYQTVYTGTDTGFTDENLDHAIGTTFRYRIVVYSESGLAAPSATVSVTLQAVKPSVPTGLNVTVSESGNLVASWDGVVRANRYELLYRATWSSTWRLANCNSTSYEVTDIADLYASTSYEFQVRSINSAGQSEYATLTFRLPPRTPETPTVTLGEDRMFHVTWSPVAAASTYVLERKAGEDSNWNVVSSGQARYVQDAGSASLAAGTVVQYRIKARGAGGETDWVYSETVTVPSYVPEAPANFTASTRSANQVALAWDAVENAVSYRLQYLKAGSSTWATAYTGTGTEYIHSGLSADTAYQYRVVAVNGDGNSDYALASTQTQKNKTAAAATGLAAMAAGTDSIVVTWRDNSTNEQGFIVQWSADGENWNTVTTAANATSCTITGLEQDTEYSIRVQATNRYGVSAYTDTVVTRTDRLLPPGTPEGMTASAASHEAVTLNWTVSATAVQTVVQRAGSPDGPWVTVATVASGGKTSQSWTDEAVAAETTYYYRFQAVNAAGNSDWSGIASATTSPAPTVPAAPTNLQLVNKSKKDVTLQWQDNAGNETGQVIQYSSNGGKTWTTITVAPGTTTYKVTGLKNNTTYMFRVLAFNEAGDSGLSNVLSVKTG